MKENYVKPQLSEEILEENDIVTSSPLIPDGEDNDWEIDW